MRGQIQSVSSFLFKALVAVCLVKFILNQEANKADQNVQQQQLPNCIPIEHQVNRNAAPVGVEGAVDEEEDLQEASWCQVMPINKGNFSDHIFQYVTSVLIAQAYEKKACVSENKHIYMSWLFDSLPLKRVPLKAYQGLYDDISFKVHVGSRDIKAFPIQDVDMVIFETTPMPVDLIEEHREQVVEMLHISRKYEDMRSTLFEIFRTKYGAESIFVGMHFRVTNDGQSILNSKMIQKLVKTAVKKISETAEKTAKVVIILSTDNPDWCRENLNLGPFNAEYLDDYRDLLKGGEPLYFDFAVLSGCSHSVINNAGAMSFWTSFLAGGNVFMTFNFPELKHKPDLISQIERADNRRYVNVAL